MKIVVDENMPYARELFSQLGEVDAVAGRTLTREQLTAADALMVRSITKVNQGLLEKTPVRFVGTATAGMDHLNTDDLDHAGIAWSAAPGCNAIAVVEYVFSALLMLAERDNFQLTDRTVGIIGAGNVGGRLQRRLEALGVRILICDPPRADRGDEGEFHSLDTLVQQADIVTFHTPLFKDGPYKTLHMADRELLASLRPDTILINACRGEVVDNQALLSVLETRHDLSVVLDVWEPEPELPLPLLDNVDIGTAHIAGYTLEGKARGTTQVFEAWSAFIGQPQAVTLSSLLPLPEIREITVSGDCDQAMLKRLAHLVYDVRLDDAQLRAVAAIPGEFDRLRKQYWQRREWSSLQVNCDNAATAEKLQQLGFTAKFTGDC